MTTRASETRVRKRRRSVWQAFFERNSGCSGTASRTCHSPILVQRKLEQAVVGHDVSEKGKRADALMKTRARSRRCALSRSRRIRPHCCRMLRIGPDAGLRQSIWQEVSRKCRERWRTQAFGGEDRADKRRWRADRPGHTGGQWFDRARWSRSLPTARAASASKRYATSHLPGQQPSTGGHVRRLGTAEQTCRTASRTPYRYRRAFTPHSLYRTRHWRTNGHS